MSRNESSLCNWKEMISKIILSLSLLVFPISNKMPSAEDILQQTQLSWCELHSFGIGFSHGNYFFCENESLDIFSGANGLKEITIRTGIIEGDDFEYDCSSAVRNGKLIVKDSYSEFLLSMLRDVLHFNVKFVSSNSWGYYEDSNSSWKGLTGFLAANVTDMAACHSTITEHLFDTADFLFPTMETTKSFVYLPENLPLTGDLFVAALSRKLWAFFLLFILLLIVSFWFSTYMHYKIRPDHEPWRWDEVVLWSVAAMSQQSFSRHPRGSSCRTMFLIGYLITYLLYTGFAAEITSLLALKSRQSHLTLENVAQMKLNLLLLREENNSDFFEKFRSHFAYLNLKDGGGENLNEIFEKIKEKNFLGFGSTITLLNYLEKKIQATHREAFVVVPAPDTIRRKAFVVQKTFPYKRIFNYWLLRLREVGLLDVGRRRYLSLENSVTYRASKWFSASLENVLSAVVFLLLGWFLSVCFLLGEIVQERKNKKE